MPLRPYTPADREACFAIFDGNCPKFVAPEERAMFERWLDNPRGRYGVYVDADGAVIGCGGIELIRMDTSQHTVGFYERLGFHTVKVTPDGYAPGLDRHDLELAVDGEFRARVFAWQWSQARVKR